MCRAALQIATPYVATSPVDTYTVVLEVGGGGRTQVKSTDALNSFDIINYVRREMSHVSLTGYSLMLTVPEL